MMHFDMLSNLVGMIIKAQEGTRLLYLWKLTNKWQDEWNNTSNVTGGGGFK